MGTKMAPNFANIFMADFEEKYILQRDNKPLFYRRYIDDVFIIWTDSEEDLQQLVADINKCHPTIKMTSEISKKSISYLDLDITIQGNRLQTTSHFKKTNTFSYLPGNSHHPNATKDGIFKGEIIRMLRNNTEREQYQKQTDFIRKKFEERNYQHRITTQNIPEFDRRPDYFAPKEKQTGYKPTLTTNFDPSLPTSDIINEHWPRLFSEETLRKKLPDKPRICYRAPRTLGSILTRAHTKTHLPNLKKTVTPTIRTPPRFPARNIPCRTTNCATCPILTSKSHFTSHQTKSYYKINDIYSCDTKNAIYLMECSICHKQYVGETGTSIRIRLRHHRNMYSSHTNRPIYRHPSIHKTDFSVYKLTIIDQESDIYQRKCREAHWIKELKTKIPFGLNVIQKIPNNRNPQSNLYNHREDRGDPKGRRKQLGHHLRLTDTHRTLNNTT